MDDEARFVVAPDGRVEEANEPALDLLGVTLEELRAAPPGAFNASGEAEAAEAMREAWETTRATAVMGETTIRRADGERVHVRYVVRVRDDGKYVFGIRRLTGRAPSPDAVFASAGQALAAWRAAERRLEELLPGSPDWERVQQEVASLRGEYRRLFQARRA